MSIFFRRIGSLSAPAFFAVLLLSLVSNLAGGFAGPTPAAAQSPQLKQLDRQASAYLRAKKYPQALSYANRYAAGIAKSFGRNHVNYAAALRKLARINSAMGRSTVARRLSAQANAITRRARLAKPPAPRITQPRPQIRPQIQPRTKPQLAKPRPLVLPPRNKQPSQPAQIASAERQVSAIARRHGRDSFHYASAMRQLATLHKRRGAHSRANQLFAEARRAMLAARAKVPKKPNEPSKMVRPHIGGKPVYQARPLLQPQTAEKRAPRFAERLTGKTNRPAVAPPSEAENLAKYRRELKAARREALKIKRRYGVNHPKYVAALRKIARLYRLMGQQKLASRYYRAADAIERKFRGKSKIASPRAPDLKTPATSTRAVINQRLGRLKQMQKALELKRNTLPAEDYQRRVMALKSQQKTLQDLAKKPGMIRRVMKSGKRPPVYRVERQRIGNKVVTKSAPVKISRTADFEERVAEMEAPPPGAVKKSAPKSAPKPSPGGGSSEAFRRAPASEPADETARSLRPAPGSTSAPTDDALLSGTPKSAAVTAAEENEAYKVVQVFYGTDRNDKGASHGTDRYGVARNRDPAKPFSYGIAEVSIPRNHEPGELEAPSIFRLEIRWNPERHVTLLRVDRLEKDDFITRLSDRVQSSANKEAFIFVHGYNVDFEYAARRTAQIAHDLRFDGAPIFYSWPSQASEFKYSVDETNVRWGTANLKQFIMDVVRRTGANHVHLIGHSMGTRALTNALIAVKQEFTPKENAVLREIVLAAPDIDADVFVRDIVPAMRDDNRRITMYASANDTALRFSKQVHGNNRAGDLSALQFIPNGIDVIDASEVKTSFLGHSFFADNDSILADIRKFIIERKSLAERFYLKKIVKPFGTYWLFENFSKTAGAQ